MKYKVGDIITIKTKKELLNSGWIEDKYGDLSYKLTIKDNIYRMRSYCFISPMTRLCGKKGIIEKINDDKFFLKEFPFCYWTEEMVCIDNQLEFEF
jgi:hypothetical protein